MRESDELARIIAAWATEVGVSAAQRPTHAARAAYLAERRAELSALARQQGIEETATALLVDAASASAERIMRAALTRGAPPPGRA